MASSAPAQGRTREGPPADLIAKTDGEEPDGKAMVMLSTMVGALMLSRVVNDPGLAGAVLNEAREELHEMVAERPRTWRHTCRPRMDTSNDR